MDDCDFAVSGPLIALNAATAGITLNSFSFGIFEPKDLVYMEINSIKYPNFTFKAVRQVAKRSRTLVIAIPRSWGLDIGDMISVTLKKIKGDEESLSRTLQLLAPASDVAEQIRKNMSKEVSDDDDAGSLPEIE